MAKTIKHTNSELLKTIYGFMISNDIRIIEEDYLYNMDEDEPTDKNIDIRVLYDALEDYTMTNLFNSERHTYILYFGFDDTGIVIALGTHVEDTIDYITIAF